MSTHWSWGSGSAAGGCADAEAAILTQTIALAKHSQNREGLAAREKYFRDAGKIMRRVLQGRACGARLQRGIQDKDLAFETV
jgi:hypothetical protein